MRSEYSGHPEMGVDSTSSLSLASIKSNIFSILYMMVSDIKSGHTSLSRAFELFLFYIDSTQVLGLIVTSSKRTPSLIHTLSKSLMVSEHIIPRENTTMFFASLFSLYFAVLSVVLLAVYTHSVLKVGPHFASFPLHSLSLSLFPTNSLPTLSLPLSATFISLTLTRTHTLPLYSHPMHVKCGLFVSCGFYLKFSQRLCSFPLSASFSPLSHVTLFKHNTGSSLPSATHPHRY